MRHVISVILQNEVGALTRMTGLFSTRGYNIESLNVAPTEDKNLSRVTLVISGSNDAFSSSCHGAGRQLSRTQARNSIDGPALRDELAAKGIDVYANTPNVLSEDAPDAYKDVDEVKRLTNEAGLARPVAKLRPVCVIKG